jgi:RNA polymerase sigma factor (sigma-70 family)
VSPDPNRIEEVPPSRVAWEELVESHAGRIRHEILMNLRGQGESFHRDRIDDLAQEVWCRLLSRENRSRPGPRLRRDGETAIYLRRVARSVVLDRLRAERAVSRRPGMLVSIDDIATPEACWIDRRYCPERRAAARATLRAYLALCRSLLGPAATRPRMRALRLAWVVGLPSVEVARQLGAGWTPTRVDSLLHRVRGRLAARGVRLPRRPGR